MRVSYFPEIGHLLSQQRIEVCITDCLAELNNTCLCLRFREANERRRHWQMDYV